MLNFMFWFGLVVNFFSPFLDDSVYGLPQEGALHPDRDLIAHGLDIDQVFGDGLSDDLLDDWEEYFGVFLFQFPVPRTEGSPSSTE